MSGAWRYTTIDCHRVFRWYPHVGRPETVRATIASCTRAGALAIPLVLPGAAFVPAVVLPALSGPAFAPYVAGGSLYAGSPYEMPLRGSATLPAVVPAGVIPAEVGIAVPTATSGSLVTPMAPLDVPHWLPSNDAPGDSVPVPEPASWALMLGMVAALIGINARKTQRGHG